MVELNGGTDGDSPGRGKRGRRRRRVRGLGSPSEAKQARGGAAGGTPKQAGPASRFPSYATNKPPMISIAPNALLRICEICVIDGWVKARRGKSSIHVFQLVATEGHLEVVAAVG